MERIGEEGQEAGKADHALGLLPLGSSRHTHWMCHPHTKSPLHSSHSLYHLQIDYVIGYMQEVLIHTWGEKDQKVKKNKKEEKKRKA